jgi:hypothetical protein
MDKIDMKKIIVWLFSVLFCLACWYFIVKRIIYIIRLWT